MSDKIRISLPVIVEGKYDKIKLDSIIDAKIITTGGFGIFNSEEKKVLIKRLCENGVILLCDSDGAGKVIRSYIKSFLPPHKVINLYIPKVEGKERRKREASKEGTLGVEGIDADILRDLFKKYEDASETERTPITKRDFYIYGLSGGDGSSMKRDKLALSFGLPSGMSANALLDALNIISSLEEFEEKMCEEI
ncbi:MAG: DUF4093 domain-containing protein [Clostridia bacterium]|nr:DUF4093 domain-containing protein [Clostridia bacterium]